MDGFTGKNLPAISNYLWCQFRRRGDNVTMSKDPTALISSSPSISHGVNIAMDQLLIHHEHLVFPSILIEAWFNSQFAQGLVERKVRQNSEILSFSFFPSRRKFN